MPPTPPPEVDDKLTVMGQLCTEPADVTPFPVKILFLIDQSASLQCTDSRNRRFQALNRVVNELLPLPQVFFGFVGFASWSRTQPFTREQDAIRPFLDPGQGLGPATDYQGALATAVRMLERDLIDSGPAVRARTRYVVVFVSDGAPEPRCRAGHRARELLADGEEAEPRVALPVHRDVAHDALDHLHPPTLVRHDPHVEGLARVPHRDRAHVLTVHGEERQRVVPWSARLRGRELRVQVARLDRLTQKSVVISAAAAESKQ